VFAAHKVVMDQMGSVSAIHWQWYSYSVLSTQHLPNWVCICALLYYSYYVKMSFDHGHYLFSIS